MNTCVICNGTKSTYTIEVPTDDDSVDAFKICGTCWDVIAEVANRRLATKIKKIEARLYALENATPSGALSLSIQEALNSGDGTYRP